MKKIILSVVCVFVAAVFSVFSANTVHLRFWDDGSLALDTEVLANQPDEPTLTNFYHLATLQGQGFLNSHDGYTFEGWRKDSPLNSETTDANEADIIRNVAIGTADIDFYAVYKKDTLSYHRIQSTNELDTAYQYLIVGQNGSNYYAMRGDNNANVKAANQVSTYKMSGLYSDQVYICENDKIYAGDKRYVWKLRGTADNWTWQNQGTPANWFELNTKERSVIYVSFPPQYQYRSNYMYNLLTTSSSPEVMSISIDNGVVTMSNKLYLGNNGARLLGYANNVLSFATSVANESQYFGKALSNVFLGRIPTDVEERTGAILGVVVSTDTYNNDESIAGKNTTNIPKGNIYLYQSEKESRYLSKFITPYTVRLKACGDNICGTDFAVSPTSLSEERSTTECVGLIEFESVDLTGVTKNIECLLRWEFAGWAQTPCADKTVSAPSFVSTDYALKRKNDTLFAVYHHLTGNYWSSYPDCNPYTAVFYPENGTMVSVSGNPYSVTEDSAGSGVAIPAAATNCTSEWTFVGWARNAIVSANNASSVVLGTSGTLNPVTNNEEYHAVYKNEALGRWTSYPLCAPAKVKFHAVAVGAKIVSNEESTIEVEENAIGSGVTLECAATGCTDTWKFAGWSRSVVASTPVEPNMFVSGIFFPVREEENLYAVYSRGEAPYKTWTSTPACAPYNVVFHACATDGCGATVNGKETDTIPEIAMGEGVSLSLTATAPCKRWEFAGWNHGSPIEHTYTNPAGDLYKSPTYVPSQDYEAFYAVYKHVDIDYWTSSPDCSDYKVYLHACDGVLSGTDSDLDSLIARAGDGITLPSATPLCSERGWTFIGWVEGGYLNTTQDVSGLTIRAAGTTYKPIRNNMHLYAVYQIAGFRQVTSSSDLVAGSEYVIAFYWDYGTIYSYMNFALSNKAHTTNTNCLNLKPIEEFMDENGHKVVIEPGDSCKWILGGNAGSGWTFKSKETNLYVSSNLASANLVMSASSTSYDINLGTNSIERHAYTSDYRYWHFKNIGVTTSPNPTFYAYQDDNPDRCYLYRSTGAVYSSWPHCQAYTVKFDGCDGIAASPSITEADAGKGIILPTVTDICDNWIFAGWAETPYDTKVTALDQNLYVAGAKYVPTHNNITLYAVYYQPKDNEFCLVPNMAGLYTGANYLIVHDHDNNRSALSNTAYLSGNVSDYGINAVNVSISSGCISGSNTAMHWRLEGYADNYVWYNPAAAKYLDLATKIGAGLLPYASLQDVEKDHFTISHNGTYFLIRSNINQYYLQKSEALDVFKSSALSSTYTYIYMQKADYCSYPCSMPAEPLRWGDGNFVVESLTHAGAPTSGSSRITGITAGENGTYVVSFDSEPSRKMRIKWGSSYYRFTVPFVASSRNTPAVENQPSQHLVILSNGSFTVEKKTWLNRLSVYEDGELVIAGGDTLWVDTLYVRSKGGDNHPAIYFGSNTSAIVINSGIIYHDLRINDAAYYPFSLPYDALVSDIRYAGLTPAVTTPPTRGTNDYDYGDDYYWIQYYNGVQRAAENGVGDTYWQTFTGSTISGGKGYTIGIYDKAAPHKERTMRFKMMPGADWSGEQNGTTTRAVTISPSLASKPVNSGWNFIGNPYMAPYYPGEINASSGLLTGEWEKDASGHWQTKTGTEAVPYFTFYDSSIDDYYQTSANMAGVKPFSAVFIQAEDAEKPMLMFTDEMHTGVSAAPWRRANREVNPIVRTGLLLLPDEIELEPITQRNYDEAGLVISNRYTNDYECGADLVKQYDSHYLHLYTMNAAHKLAFNALDEEAAAQPIKLGVTIPKTGSYAFCFDWRQYDPEALEALWLTDYENGQAVNLLEDIYTCTINKGVNESRFVINAIIRKENNTTTNVDIVPENGIQILTHNDGSITVRSSEKLTGLMVHDIAGRLVGEWTPNSYQWTLNLPQGVYAISAKGENGQVTHIKICSK